MPFLLAGVVLIVLGVSIGVRYGPWHDDGDCRGIVVHTVRVATPEERYDMWREKYGTLCRDVIGRLCIHRGDYREFSYIKDVK